MWDALTDLVVELEEEVEKGSEEKRNEDPTAVVGNLGVMEWIEKHKGAFEK